LRRRLGRRPSARRRASRMTRAGTAASWAPC
jgi:hypothetical protein